MIFPTFTIPTLTVPFYYKGATYQIPLPEVKVQDYALDHLRKVVDALEAYDEYSEEYICHHLEGYYAKFEALEDALRAKCVSHSLEGLVYRIIDDWGCNDDARPIRIQWAKHMAAHIRDNTEEA